MSASGWVFPWLSTIVVVEAAAQTLEILRGLVAGAVRAPEDEAPRGARAEELDSLQARLGCFLPPALKAWLSVCRGARIGPGGLFGPRPALPRIDMALQREFYPRWGGLGWLPVAGDGCGD